MQTPSTQIKANGSICRNASKSKTVKKLLATYSNIPFDMFR